MPVTIDPTARLLVTGASGQLGQRVLLHLLDTLRIDPTRIVAGSRSVEKLQLFADRGVTTCFLDFKDVTSVEAAARGVDRALLVSTNDIFDRVNGQKRAVQAFIKAGVQHILYTSIAGVDTSVVAVKHDHVATEQCIKESHVPRGYTILRNGHYFENDLGFIASAKYSGKWFSAARDGKIAGIARDDLALANAMALASDNYEKQVYELSGAVGLTIDEVAANVSRVLGKPIQVVQVTEDVVANVISTAAGFSLDEAMALATFDTNMAMGHGDVKGDDFFKLTGKQPLSHADWATAHATLFASF